MTADQVMGLLLGHMAGDYLFQNEWMALNKARKGRWMPGLVHALVYTVTVYALTIQGHIGAEFLPWRQAWFCIIFLSHWPVDRWSLADRWLKQIGGRTLEGFMFKGHHDIELMKMAVTDKQIPAHGLPYTENYRILRGGFHALVYAATDNTIHLLLMWGGWHLLSFLGL